MIVCATRYQICLKLAPYCATDTLKRLYKNNLTASCPFKGIIPLHINVVTKLHAWQLYFHHLTNPFPRTFTCTDTVIEFKLCISVRDLRSSSAAICHFSNLIFRRRAVESYFHMRLPCHLYRTSLHNTINEIPILSHSFKAGTNCHEDQSVCPQCHGAILSTVRTVMKTLIFSPEIQRSDRARNSSRVRRTTYHSIFRFFRFWINLENCSSSAISSTTPSFPPHFAVCIFLWLPFGRNPYSWTISQRRASLVKCETYYQIYCMHDLIAEPSPP